MDYADLIERLSDSAVELIAKAAAQKQEIRCEDVQGLELTASEKRRLLNIVAAYGPIHTPKVG